MASPPPPGPNRKLTDQKFGHTKKVDVDLQHIDTHLHSLSGVSPKHSKLADSAAGSRQQGHRGSKGARAEGSDTRKKARKLLNIVGGELVCVSLEV